MNCSCSEFCWSMPRHRRLKAVWDEDSRISAVRAFHSRGARFEKETLPACRDARNGRSHPWHFRCWSLRRNELECTDLVHWTEPLHCFSSRDAIIVVGSVLEKHFDGDFTPDQEKKITFKRWPPGYQSWKLGLALNGLNTVPGWKIFQHERWSLDFQKIYM